MSGWDSLIAPYTAPPAAPEIGGGVVDSAYVVNGLMERGLPQHVAEAFAMNMQDESGFDPGINEINPTVKGSRGGYGLYQLTGPRRRAYEAFAAERGTALNDPDAQLDFLVMELAGPEKRAAERIMSTSNAGEAGAAIVNYFLRPAEKHRAAREAKYLGGAQPAPQQQAQNFNRLWLDMGIGGSNG